MAQFLLTATSLAAELKTAAAHAAERQTRVRISDGNNLYLVVRENGTASWQLLAWVAGKRKPITLGRWPDLTLKRARELAQSQRDAVASGVDPVAAKRQERAQAKIRETAEVWTTLRLFNRWLDKHQGSAVYIGNITAAFKKDVLPAIGAKHPGQVTRAEILKIMRDIERRDSLDMVRRVRMWLRQMFEFGIDDEAVPVDSMPVPTGHLHSFASHKGGSFAAITDPDEAAAMMRKINAYGSTIVRTLLILSAHLFQRPTELRTATWDQFDLDGARWTLPEDVMKMGDEHWVPLSPQVVRILRAHQGVVGSDGLLFPGRKYGQPVSESTGLEALRRMGYAGKHTVHGFRAMANTILVEKFKVNERHVDKQLSHKDANEIRRVYNRAEFLEERIEFMSLWSGWLDEQMRAR